MKILLFIICFSLTSLKSTSQINHTFNNTVLLPASGPTSIQKNKWYKSIKNETITHIQFFNRNTVGVKKAIELIEEICSNNNFDYEEPDEDKSYLASYVESMNDYENLNLSISTGGSIIDKVWFRNTSNGKVSMLRISLTEDSYSVSVVNPK